VSYTSPQGLSETLRAIILEHTILHFPKCVISENTEVRKWLFKHWSSSFHLLPQSFTIGAEKSVDLNQFNVIGMVLKQEKKINPF